MVDLAKRVQTAGVVLAKKGLTAPPIMRVWMAIDISGSMDDEIRDGSVQKVMDQLQGVAGKFDDDGSIDVVKFDDRAEYVGVCEASDYGRYVNSAGIRARGGTAFSPFITLITNKLFPAPAPQKSGGIGGLFGLKKEAAPAPVSDVPVLVLIITDGEPMSEGHYADEQYRRIAPALQHAAQYPIYWHFVGINNQGVEFKVLKQLADDLPNVGFIKMNGFNKSDEELYNEVLCDELIAWVKKAGKNANAATA